MAAAASPVLMMSKVKPDTDFFPCSPLPRSHRKLGLDEESVPTTPVPSTPNRTVWTPLASAAWPMTLVASTPEVKSQMRSPPSCPIVHKKRLQDDIDLALQRKSLPLLSLTLLRGHSCGDNHGIHEAVRRQHMGAPQQWRDRKSVV